MVGESGGPGGGGGGDSGEGAAAAAGPFDEDDDEAAPKPAAKARIETETVRRTSTRPSIAAIAKGAGRHHHDAAMFPPRTRGLLAALLPEAAPVDLRLIGKTLL